MQAILIILLTIVISVAGLAAYYIITYNRIQFSKIRVDEAEKVILDELNTRYELIGNTKPFIEKNTKMDLNLYDDLESLKNTNVDSYEFEKRLTIAINTIYMVKNDYPKIEEKKDFKEIITKLNESDTKIDAAKSFYNKHNTKLLSLIRTFPSNIVCLIHGIKAKPYYEAKEIFNEIDDGIKI